MEKNTFFPFFGFVSNAMNLFFNRECLPSGVSFFSFYLEDYWLFQSVEKISNKLPKADWTGIFDTFSLWSEANFKTDQNSLFPFKKEKNNNLSSKYNIKNYTKSKPLAKVLETGYQPSKITLSPTHIVSRLSYEHFVKEYPNLMVVCIDAHDDRGEINFPDNLWLHPEIVPKTVLIGGKTAGTNVNGHDVVYKNHFGTIKETIESHQLIKALANQNILLSIDLDYFQESEWGFPTYLLREKFTGHSQNIYHRFMDYLSINPNISNESILIGQILGLFSSQNEIDDFKKKRIEAIKLEGERVQKEVMLIIEFLIENGCNITTVDICEFCFPLDCQFTGRKQLEKLFNLLVGELISGSHV